jgi:predicted HTH domain antitoxin
VEAPFPDGFSVYGEAVVGWDAVRLGGLRQRHLHLSLAVEAFTWGRVDVDGRLAAQLAERRVEVAVSALATGVGRPEARYLYSGEVRWRFGGWLYAVGQGGTLLFPTPGEALRPGAFASLGLGVDHAR